MSFSDSFSFSFDSGTDSDLGSGGPGADLDCGSEFYIGAGSGTCHGIYSRSASRRRLVPGNKRKVEKYLYRHDVVEPYALLSL